MDFDLEQFFSWPAFIQMGIDGNDEIRLYFDRMGIGMDEVRKPFGFPHIYHLLVMTTPDVQLIISGRGPLSERSKNELWWKMMWMLETMNPAATDVLTAAMNGALERRTLDRRSARWLLRRSQETSERADEASD
jgi:hypothetical protein